MEIFFEVQKTNENLKKLKKIEKKMKIEKRMPKSKIKIY